MSPAGREGPLEIKERLWCNRCQANTEHVRRRFTPLQLASCLMAPFAWLAVQQVGMETKNPSRCAVCGRAHSGRVLKKG
jgi:hypothetical protein